MADGEDEVRRACRQELRQGAAFIKIMANGGVASPTDPIAWQGYSEREMRAAVEEAADAQTYVAAHLYTAEAIARAVRAGVHSLEHCNRIDAPTAARCGRGGRGRGADPGDLRGAGAGRARASACPPTASPRSRMSAPPASKASSIMREAGLPMAFGTDLLGETHGRQSEEFAILAPRAAGRRDSRSATTEAARLIGMEGRLGVVAPGAIADLLVVDGDPLRDVAVLARPEHNVRLVMKAGTIHRNALAG